MLTAMRFELVAATTALLLIPVVARAQHVVRVIGGGEPLPDYTELHAAEAAARKAQGMYVDAAGVAAVALYKATGPYSVITPPGCNTAVRGIHDDDAHTPFTPAEIARCDAPRIKAEASAKAKCARAPQCKVASDNKELARVAQEQADAAYEALACSLEGAEPRAACGHILGTVCLAGVPCHRPTAAEIAQRDLSSARADGPHHPSCQGTNSNAIGALAKYWPNHGKVLVNERSRCHFWVPPTYTCDVGATACDAFCADWKSKGIGCTCWPMREKSVPAMCSRLTDLDPAD